MAATTVTSTARVVTDAAARYATQLAAHLGRKATVEAGPEGDRVVLGAGSCLLRVEPGALTLEAVAADEAALARVQQVVGDHLERFGRRAGLTVHWAAGPSRPR